VAEAALQVGVNWVNDITGLTNPAMRAVVAKWRCPVVLMHMQGTPQTMQARPRYSDVVTDIKQFFAQQITLAKQAGIARQRIILDPGIGFGKTMRHNLELIRRLNELTSFRLPLLVGASRKSFIGKLTGAAVIDRLPGTLAVHAAAVLHGATWLRVHDVTAHKQYLTVDRELAR
jgi:dihydropteroate synthase